MLASLLSTHCGIRILPHGVVEKDESHSLSPHRLSCHYQRGTDDNRDFSDLLSSIDRSGSLLFLADTVGRRRLDSGTALYSSPCDSLALRI